MEVAVINWNFIALLGKQAGDLAKSTVRSESIPMNTAEGKERAAAGLKRGLNPAARVAPTRYGRKPYTRTAK